MSKMFFWTQGRNYGKSQFFKQMEEEMRMSRGREVPVPLEPKEGFEITEAKTNLGRTIVFEKPATSKNGMCADLEYGEFISSVTERPIRNAVSENNWHRELDRAVWQGKITQEDGYKLMCISPDAVEYLRVGKAMTEGFEKGLNIKHDSIQEAVRSLQEKSVVNTGEAYAGVIQELSETYVKKNADYGNSFEKTLDKRGLIPAIVRMEEKMERMEKIWDTEKTLVEDEDIIDSAMDLANYAIMTAMWLKKKQIKTNNVKYGGADFDGDTIKISDKEIGSFNFPIGQQFNSDDK